MDLIRSDESAACNAISVALLHVFVDRVDGWMNGLLLAGKVDFKEQRSPLLPRMRSICARSDRPACALSFSIHKIDLQPAQRSDIAPLPAVSVDPSLAPLHTVSPRCINGSLIAGPYRHLAVLLLPLAAHSAKISTTWLRIDVKRIHGGGEMMAGPEGSCSLL